MYPLFQSYLSVSLFAWLLLISSTPGVVRANNTLGLGSLFLILHITPVVCLIWREVSGGWFLGLDAHSVSFLVSFKSCALCCSPAPHWMAQYLYYATAAEEGQLSLH